MIYYAFLYLKFKSQSFETVFLSQLCVFFLLSHQMILPAEGMDARIMAVRTRGGQGGQWATDNPFDGSIIAYIPNS